MKRNAKKSLVLYSGTKGGKSTRTTNLLILKFTTALYITHGKRNISAVVGVVGMEVKCPNCDHVFDSASERGKGAQYTKDWTNMGKALLNMCAFWISNPDIRNHALPKSALLAYFNEKGYSMAALPFSGRISELLGLGLVIMQQGEIKEGMDTTRAPTYRLDIPKVSEILNKAGDLQK